MAHHWTHGDIMRVLVDVRLPPSTGHHASDWRIFDDWSETARSGRLKMSDVRRCLYKLEDVGLAERTVRRGRSCWRLTPAGDLVREDSTCEVISRRRLSAVIRILEGEPA